MRALWARLWGISALMVALAGMGTTAVAGDPATMNAAGTTVTVPVGQLLDTWYYDVRLSVAGGGTALRLVDFATSGPAPAQATPLTIVGNGFRNAAGQTLLPRGVNVPVFGSGYTEDLDAVAQAVAASGANMARLVWWGNTANGWTQGAPTLYTVANLERAIQAYASRGVLPMLELHDATRYLAVGMGADKAALWNDAAEFRRRITAFWTRADVMDVIRRHQHHLVVNLANEWGYVGWDAASMGTNALAYLSNYEQALAELRAAWARAGIGPVPLVIDMPDNGTNLGFLSRADTPGSAKVNASRLYAADPAANLMFSVHAYWPENYGTNAQQIAELLRLLSVLGLPVTLGEVGTNANGSPCDTDRVLWGDVMQQAQLRGVGTLAWAWYQDGSCADMNITPDGLTLPPAQPAANSFAWQIAYNASYGLKTAARIDIAGAAATPSAIYTPADGRLRIDALTAGNPARVVARSLVLVLKPSGLFELESYQPP